MTDTDALQRYARRRDPEAFAHLVESYQQMVYAVCLRRLGHEADARDATQDTFVKLAKSAGDIRAAGGSVVGWLHRCATTTSIDLIRRESRRRGRERAVAVMEQTPSADPPWEDVRSALDEALGELPEAQRDLIVQRYLVGRRQNQLAAEAGISASMVSRRVSAALETLRERLQAKGFGVGAAALTTGLAAESAMAVPVGLTAMLTGVGTTTLASTSGTAAVATSAAATSHLAPVSWLWLGTKIKLSTAILGSLAIHAVLVGVVLWLGAGLSTLVTPPASPSVAPQPAGSTPSLPVSPPTAPPPRPAEAPHVIRVAVADAEAVEPSELATTADDSAAEVPAGFVYMMGSITRPGAYTVPADTNLTLKQLIATAGGTDVIDERPVRLIRRNEGEPQEQTVVVVEAILREVIDTPIGDTQIQPDDLVVVGDVAADDITGIENGWEPAFKPSILDPALTGEWLLLAEGRDGRLAPQITEDGEWLARLVFDGDEWRVYSADEAMFARTRLTLEPSGPEDKLQWVDTVLESRGISGNQAFIGEPYASDWRKPYRIEGDRLYVGDLIFNEETGSFDPLPAGQFSKAGYRTFFARPAEAQEFLASDALRIEQETGKQAELRRLRVAASGAEGWRTATLFDVEVLAAGRAKLLDVEAGRLWTQPGGVRVGDREGLLAFMEQEKLDLHVRVAAEGGARLISDMGLADRSTRSTFVGDLPFTATLLTADGTGMEVMVERVDAAARSVTLHYRTLVGEIAESAWQSGGSLRNGDIKIEFERWRLDSLIQQAFTPLRWPRTRIEGITLPIEEYYNGCVVAADPQTAFRELLTQEFGFAVRRVTEETEALVLRLPADGTHRLTPSDPDATESGATGHRDYTQFTGMNSQSLAASLEHRVPGPVIDETGLTGNWDFRLPRFKGESLAEAAAMIRESLGFEVVIETRPVEYAVIEAKR